MPAIFINERAALSAAIKVASAFRSNVIPALHCRVFPVIKRGALVGYEACYLSGPKFRPVFEDQL